MVANYICHDGNQERNYQIQASTPPFCCQIGCDNVFDYTIVAEMPQ